MDNIIKCKFDYDNFYSDDGWLFVAHAKKYSKEEFIELCREESPECHNPTVNDIASNRARWSINTPVDLFDDDDEREGACYMLTDNKRGSFPVWAIKLEG